MLLISLLALPNAPTRQENSARGEEKAVKIKCQRKKEKAGETVC
jgi:hypothetical protein